MKINICWFRKIFYSILITAILLNTSFLTIFSNPNKAKACSDNLFINEFVSYPNSGNDWIELFNESDSEIDLDNWYIKDAGDNRLDLTGIIEPYGYAVFEWSNKLNKSGDAIKLYDNTDTQKDIVIYGAAGDVIAPSQGKSAARLPDGKVWYTNQEPTKGYANPNPPDNIAPESTITTPTNGAYYNVFEKIEGTAEDCEGSGIEEVIVTIKNTTENEYFNGNTWQASESEDTILNTVFDENTNTWYYNFSDTNLVDGNEYAISSKAKDKAQNWQEDYTTSTFIYDITNPEGTVKINEGKQVTNSKNVTLDLTYSDDAEKMLISNQDNFTDKTDEDWENVSEQKNWILTDGNGEKKVYIKYKDHAGNQSEKKYASIYYNNKATDINKETIDATTKSYDLYGNGKLLITAKANQATTLTYAKYSSNPGVTTGFSVLGNYFDLSFENNEAIDFTAVRIEIYFTQQDLTDAGITDISQIQGLYYFDSNSQTWKLYSDTGVQATNNNGFIGYVWANVDHLTPLVIGSDTVAPEKVNNLSAQAKDGSIVLNWDKLSDAKYYEIRYGKINSNNNVESYSEMIITTNNQTEILNLTNNQKYEFSVRAVDEAGNKGEWTSIIATPTKTTITDNKTKTKIYYATYEETIQTNDNTIKTEKNEQTTNSDKDDIKISDEDAKGETQSAKTAVTLGIIIIAIGAALGGYYGYQWWLSEGSIEEKPLPKKQDTHKAKKTNPAKKKIDRRW